ncbi:MAG: TolC family protein [Sandaracinus sp.]
MNLALFAGGLLALTLPVIPALAQGAPPTVTVGLTYPDYLHRVGEANLDLVAERAGVDQADARIDLARVFPSPRLSGGVSMVDVSGTSAPTMTLLQLDVPVDLSDRVGHRTALASAQAREAHAQLDATAWSLRAEAGTAWVDALYAQAVLDRTQRALATFERVIEIDRQRLEAGSIGEVQVLQSRVEAERYRGRVLEASAELDASLLVVSRMMGNAPSRAPAVVAGSLEVPAHDLDATALVELARTHRPDVQAARATAVSAHEARSLVSSERMFDLVLSVNWQHSFPSIGTPFNTPDYDTLGVLASAELPVRLFWHGDVDQAEARIVEADTRVAAVELLVDVEIRAALARYEAARRRVELYRGTILDDAERVREAAFYAYQRGSGSLLEVLIAQRTADDVYLEYYDALATHARLLVELERVTGSELVTF